MAENKDEIRPEAFERLKQDKAELQAQVSRLEDSLGTVVKDTKFLNDAYAHFRGNKEIADPYGVALQAVKDVTLKGTEPDALGETLDGWLNDLKGIFGQSGQPPAVEDHEQPPVADTAPPPGFARPNPAADGQPPAPGTQMIETHSKEFKNLMEANNMAEIERLDKAGLIAWKTSARE